MKPYEIVLFVLLVLELVIHAILGAWADKKYKVFNARKKAILDAEGKKYEAKLLSCELVKGKDKTYSARYKPNMIYIDEQGNEQKVRLTYNRLLTIEEVKYAKKHGVKITVARGIAFPDFEGISYVEDHRKDNIFQTI